MPNIASFAYFTGTGVGVFIGRYRRGATASFCKRGGRVRFYLRTKLKDKYHYHLVKDIPFCQGELNTRRGR